MPESYVYELWNGKKVIGTVNFFGPILGTKAVFPTISEFKRQYGRNYETIEVPLMYLSQSISYREYSVKTVLDVRKKSKRQIKLLLENFS